MGLVRTDLISSLRVLVALAQNNFWWRKDYRPAADEK
jgi:hypothetical protein